VGEWTFYHSFCQTVTNRSDLGVTKFCGENFHEPPLLNSAIISDM
jgi:hypothetical protein